MTNEATVYRIQPADVPSPIGFTVDIHIGWRSIEARFTPGTFAAELVRAMEQSDAQQRIAFRIFAKSARNDGANLTFRINSAPTDPMSESWPHGWKSCDLLLRRGNLMWGEDVASDDEQIRSWTCRFVGLIVALLPLEPVVPAVTGETEGTVVEVLSRRYERSRLNRTACIEIQGQPMHRLRPRFRRHLRPYRGRVHSRSPRNLGISRRTGNCDRPKPRSRSRLSELSRDAPYEPPAAAATRAPCHYGESTGTDLTENHFGMATAAMTCCRPCLVNAACRGGILTHDYKPGWTTNLYLITLQFPATVAA